MVRQGFALEPGHFIQFVRIHWPHMEVFYLRNDIPVRNIKTVLAELYCNNLRFSFCFLYQQKYSTKVFLAKYSTKLFLANYSRKVFQQNIQEKYFQQYVQEKYFFSKIFKKCILAKYSRKVFFSKMFKKSTYQILFSFIFPKITYHSFTFNFIYTNFSVNPFVHPKL